MLMDSDDHLGAHRGIAALKPCFQWGVGVETSADAFQTELFFKAYGISIPPLHVNPLQLVGLQLREAQAGAFGVLVADNQLSALTSTHCRESNSSKGSLSWNNFCLVTTITCIPAFSHIQLEAGPALAKARFVANDALESKARTTL